MLVFRVGRADETLARAGLTHLVEHLVMPTSRARDYERNATVENIFTRFWASGPRDDVLEFLERTVAAIANPPLDRIALEREILLTEAASRGAGPVAGAMGLRFGPAGHGVIASDELGLNSPTAEQVQAWMARSFTVENCALWMTGRPPRTLDLPLPHGERLTPPEPTPIDGLELPAYYPYGPPEVVHASLVAERSVALSMGLDIATERAWQTLRWERGHAYDLFHLYEPLNRTTARFDLGVECLERNVSAVAAGVLEVLSGLVENGPSREELDGEVASHRKASEDDTNVTGSLVYSVDEELLGAEHRTWRQLNDEREQLSPDDVAAAVAEGMRSLLLLLPFGAEPPKGLALYPTTSTAEATGTEYRPDASRLRKFTRTSRLILGDDCVAVISPPDTHSVVRLDDCVAMQRWPDGSRTVVGSDSFFVHVDPEAWKGGEEIVQLLDERIPADLVVVMEPELTARVERVDKVVSEKLKRRWLVSEELKRLPHALRDEEKLLTLGAASYGWRWGLLVVTDQRLLWLYGDWGDRDLERDYESFDSVEFERAFMESKVVIEKGFERVEFQDVAPKERAEEIAVLVGTSSTSAPRPGPSAPVGA